jgi:superfamily II DNA or RNA helicase
MSSLGKLRDYQEAALEHLRRRIRDGERRLYVSLPTGSGKTITLAHLVAEVRERRGRVLWVVHLRELVTQAADVLGVVVGEDVGIVMPPRRDVGADLIVGSVQSLAGRPRLAQVLEAGAIDLLVIDEAHHITGSNRYSALVQAVEASSPDVVVVGATATPYRSDRHRMQDVLPDCAFERSIEQMQSTGVLCDLDWRAISIGGLDLTRIRTGAVHGDRDFVERDLARAMSRSMVVEATISATAQHLRGRTALAFGVDVKHAHLLAEGYRSVGLRARAVWGTMPGPERAEVLTAWRQGEVDMVTNCQVLGEGFDLPKIDALVMARPTMSPGLYVQQLGRGMRPAEGKDDCLVLDLTGRAGLIDARQVRLPDIIGVEDGDGFEQGRDRRRAGPRSLLMDPYGQARWAWGSSPGRFGKAYYAGIGQGVHSALVPDRHGSGLYHAFVAGQSLTPALQRVSLRPVPLREAVAAVEVSLTQSGFAGYLAHRDRRWRDDEPTTRQLAYLRMFDREQAALAEAEEWTKGDVSTAIVGHQVLGLLRKERVV